MWAIRYDIVTMVTKQTINIRQKIINTVMLQEQQMVMVSVAWLYVVYMVYIYMYINTCMIVISYKGKSSVDRIGPRFEYC